MNHKQIELLTTPFHACSASPVVTPRKRASSPKKRKRTINRNQDVLYAYLIYKNRCRQSQKDFELFWARIENKSIKTIETYGYAWLVIRKCKNTLNKFRIHPCLMCQIILVVLLCRTKCLQLVMMAMASLLLWQFAVLSVEIY